MPGSRDCRFLGLCVGCGSEGLDAGLFLQTFIAGLTADGLVAPWVIKGAMDGPAFAAYVKEVLVPVLSPGTVVILDNLATHRNAAAAHALRQAGCWFR